MRISLDLHLKRPRRSSTSQHGRTFSKGHTDSGPEAELIRTSSLHKLSRGVQLSSCFWQSPERWQKRQFSPSPPAPAPSLAVGKWHQQCALSDTSLPTQLGPSLVLGWSSCQAGALMIQLTQSCWSWHKGRESSGSVEPGAEKAAVLGWWQPVMKRDSKLRPWQSVYLNELFHSWLWHSLSDHKDSLPLPKMIFSHVCPAFWQVTHAGCTYRYNPLKLCITLMKTRCFININAF